MANSPAVKLVIITGMLTFSAGFSGAALGVSSTNTDADINGSKSFELGLINTGQKPLNLDFSFENVSKGQITPSSTSITLEPSAQESSPDGANWYYLGERYVKIRYWTFEYIPERTQGKDSFNLNIQAAPTSLPGSPNGPRIVQVREIDYDLDITNDGSNGGITWTQQYSKQDEKKSAAEHSTNSSADTRQKTSPSQNSQDSKTENTGQKDSINFVTIVFLLITLLTLAYILYEI